MEPDKVCTIVEWPKPSCCCDIQVFYSFANFFRRFISSFLHLTKPMTDMPKEEKNSHFVGPFLPSQAIKQSLEELCDSFTRAPVLTQFDPAMSICLEPNASGFTITGITLQQQVKVCGSAGDTVCGAK